MPGRLDLRYARREGHAGIVETRHLRLRDPSDRVARNAANALATLRASEAIPAIEALARRLDLQQRVGVERTLATLRSTDKVDGSALKKQVEELQEKVRKLEDQVQKLQ